MLFRKQIKSVPDIRTKIGKVIRVDNGLLDVMTIGGSAPLRGIKSSGGTPNVGDPVLVSYYKNGEVVATPESSNTGSGSGETTIVSSPTYVNQTGSFIPGLGLETDGGGTTNVVTVSGRTQITGNGVDVNTSLLPSPTISEKGHFLMASGAGSSGWSRRIYMPDDDTLVIQNHSLLPVITLDALDGAEFSLPMTLGANGGIWQGTGTFASPTTGLKIWNDTGVGRIAGYSASVLQWYASSDGKLYAGAGGVKLDSSGITLVKNSGYVTSSSIKWGNDDIYVVGRRFLSMNRLELVSQQLGSGENAAMHLTAAGGAGGGIGQIGINASGDGLFSQISITSDSGIAITGDTSVTGNTTLVGNLRFSATNTYDIGSSGLNPRNITVDGYVIGAVKVKGAGAGYSILAAPNMGYDVIHTFQPASGTVAHISDIPATYVHPNHSGDATSVADGAITFATVNANVGTFGSTTQSVQLTVNAKGLITGISNQTIVIPTVSGTTGTVPKFTATNTIGDSIITESSSKIGINGTLKLGSSYTRSGAIFDVIGSDTASIASIASGTLTFNYGGPYGNVYWNDGYNFQYDIWAYRTHNGTKIFSSTALSLSDTDDNGSNSYYSVDLAWDAIPDSDGYLVRVKNDNYYGASNDYYFEVQVNYAHISGGSIWELGSDYVYGAPSTTPTTTTGTGDFYLTKTGDLYSTKKLIFSNIPTLQAGNLNGIRVYGNPNYTVELPVNAKIHLGALSLNSGVDAYEGQMIFPTGASGDTSPGIRMVGGGTDGGLAMNSGILEFWNNWRAYCTHDTSKMQGIFRFDTRSGYEAEGFTIGGTLNDNTTDFMAIGVNYSNADVNLAYYGIGSVSIGTDTGTAGIGGTNGHLAVKNDIYMGRDVVANSSNGIKFGTATSQKLGFWNTTPIIQPTTGVGSASFTANSGTAVNNASTFDGYTLQQVVQALRNIGLLA